MHFNAPIVLQNAHARLRRPDHPTDEDASEHSIILIASQMTWAAPEWLPAQVQRPFNPKEITRDAELLYGCVKMLIHDYIGQAELLYGCVKMLIHDYIGQNMRLTRTQVHTESCETRSSCRRCSVPSVIQESYALLFRSVSSCFTCFSRTC